MDRQLAGELAVKVGRVAGHVLVERARPPVVRARGDVPRSPDDATADWLTACLCGEYPGVRVSGLEVLGGSSGTSTRRRLRVKYTAPGPPEHLYVKTTTTLTQRLMLGLTSIIEVEGLTYERVLPLLDLEAPAGYASGFEPRSWRSFVITEDVAETRGAVFYSPQDELTVGQAKELLSAMANWHGTLWEHPVLHQGWLQTTAQRQAVLSRFLDWGKRAAVGIKRIGDIVPGALAARHADAVRAFDRSLQIASEGAMTFLHGDPHAGGNYYRTRDGRMGWADWGVCLRGSWAYDVGYFLASSLPVECRRAWERELLTHYLEQLARAGGGAPDFEDAWLVYRQQLIYPYIAWASVHGHGPLQPDSQPPEYCLPIIERAAHAVEDLGAVDAVLLPPTRTRSAA